MSQNYTYPATSSTVTITAVGTNGATAPTTSMEVGGKDGSGNLQPLSVNSSGVLNVSASALPLPSGAATSAKQDTGNTSLASIDGKTPALGQALAAGSVPVVLTASQLTTLTPPATFPSVPSTAVLTGSASAINTTVITGDVSAYSALMSQTTGGASYVCTIQFSNDNSSWVSGIGYIVGGGNVVTTISTDNLVYIPVAGKYFRLRVTSYTSGTVTATVQCTNAPINNSELFSYQGGSWNVGQAGTWNVTNVSGTVSLPTGASTSALQTTGNTSIASIDTKTPAVGQAAMAASSPVTLASDQTGINTFLDKASANQNLTGSGQAVTVSANGCSSAGIQITGTFTATLTFEGTTDGTNWFSIYGVNRGSTAQLSSTASGATNVVANISGCTQFRVRCSAYTSGTAVVSVACSAGASSYAISQNSNNFIVAAAQTGTWTVQPGNTANTTAWLVNEEKAATATCTNVAASATSVSLLASTAGRKNATFFNDSTATLYLKFGTTASATSYTVQIPGNGYYELPSGRIYTGAIDGIWSAATGTVRITELS